MNIKQQQSAEDYIRNLDLQPHPEGGFYREIYRSEHTLFTQHNETESPPERNLLTSIYFLLHNGDTSCFHRLKSDEIWYFHAGDPIAIHTIDAQKSYRCVMLGPDAGHGEVPQMIIPAGTLFGAGPAVKNGFTLVGCAVAPGFDFRDFEMFDPLELLQLYPQHEEIIRRVEGVEEV
jgi:uncharacterized protein